MRDKRPRRPIALSVAVLEERVAPAGGMATAGTRLIEHVTVSTHHERASHQPAFPATRALDAQSVYPFENPILPEYPAITRLALFNNATQQFQTLTTSSLHTIANSTTTAKNVYVIAHGWAPGYLDWVKRIQTQKGNPLPLSWNTWQGTNLPSDGPTTPWLYHSSKTKFGFTSFTISDKGLAQQILSVDPNATVLAYSWIDDSATPSGTFGIPKNPEHSEGNTTMNGMRMAQAIMEALTTNYDQGLGKVHLIGHSHGARVATEAALALQQAAKVNPQFNVVGQLTLFDSPENNNASTNDRNPIWIDAANYDWFLLAQLNNIARPVGTNGSLRMQPNTIFVDSYNSYFGQDLGNFVVNDPAQGLKNKHLSNLVDVKLVALNRAYDAFAFSNMHQYAANWYAGSVATTKAPNPAPVGMLWSPLLANPKPVPAQQLKQGWSYFGAVAKNQFKLEPDKENPVTPTFFSTPLTQIKTSGSVKTTTDSNKKVTGVTLSSAQGKVEFDGQVRKQSGGVVGFSFECNFTQVGDGSQLQILLNGSVYFAMSGGVADSSNLPGNADFNTTVGFAGVGNDPKITMRLVQPASSTGTPTVVTVSNFHEFKL
jgi:pimeloyl-ACP methyl ester carboxylesterase